MLCFHHVRKVSLLHFLFLLHPFTARITFARFLYRLILLRNCRRELDNIFWNFGIRILAGIVIRAKYCWKRMKEITAEIKFLAGVKNQCSVRKAGIGKPEQGVRQKSSEIFLCSTTFQ
jgi:hypothetical protein